MWSLGTLGTGHAYLSMRVVFVLKRPCLGLMNPFSLLSMLGPTAPEFLITSILPLWPVLLWPGKCLGVLLVEPLLGPPHSFLLLELLWVPTLCAGNVGFPLTGWILGVTQSLQYPLGGDFSMLPTGVPSACQIQQGQLVPSASEWSVGKGSPV